MRGDGGRTGAGARGRRAFKEASGAGLGKAGFLYFFAKISELKIVCNQMTSKCDYCSVNMTQSSGNKLF